MSNLKSQEAVELPRGWILASLGEVASINPKIENKENIPSDLIVQFLPMKLVEEKINKIHLTETRAFSEVQKGSYTPFVDGDILFAKVTPCMENGKVAVAHNLINGIGYGSSEFHVLRSGEAAFNKFLFYFIVQDKFRNDAQNAMTGAVGLRRVPKQFIESYIIPLPPKPTQLAIVSKIEELFSELDKGIEQLKTAQQQLKTYRQAVLKWAFEGKLTNDAWAAVGLRSAPQELGMAAEPEVAYGKESGLPNGWKTVSVKDVAETYGGYAFKSGEFKSSGKYQVLRMGNIRPGVIRYDESPVYLDAVDENVLRRALLETNDIVITQTGTRKKRDYGFTALIPKSNLLLNQRIAAIRLSENYLPKFFLYFSWTDKFKDQFFANETGNVGQGNVGMKAVTETLIPFCSIAEQNKVVQEIESRFSVADKMEESITQSLQQAEALRQSILKKAFEGRLV